MRVLRVAPFGLLLAGVLLVGDAVARGRATVSWVLVVPVVSGASLEFLAGSLLLVVGLFAVPLAFAFTQEDELPPPAALPPSAGPTRRATGASGVVLVGPLPIFFGGWADLPARTRRWVALAGAAAMVALLVAGLLWVR